MMELRILMPDGNTRAFVAPGRKSILSVLTALRAFGLVQGYALRNATGWVESWGDQPDTETPMLAAVHWHRVEL